MCCVLCVCVCVCVCVCLFPKLKHIQCMYMRQLLLIAMLCTCCLLATCGRLSPEIGKLMLYSKQLVASQVRFINYLLATKLPQLYVWCALVPMQGYHGKGWEEKCFMLLFCCFVVSRLFMTRRRRNGSTWMLMKRCVCVCL